MGVRRYSLNAAIMVPFLLRWRPVSDPIEDPDMIRVIVALEQPLRLVGAVTTLDAADDIEVVGQTSVAADVIDLVGRNQPDVLLLESDFQRAEPGLMPRLLELDPSLAVIVCVAHSDEECALRHLAGDCGVRLSDEALERLDDCCLVGLRAHARGCVPGSSGPDQILEAVRHVYLGELVAAPWLKALLPASFERRGGIGIGPERITARELEVIELVGHGLSNKEIAARLGIREQTIKNHIGRVLRKLHLRNRMELAVFAVQHHMARAAPAG